MTPLDRHQPCQGCTQQKQLGRRRFLGLLSAGAALVMAGCGMGSRSAARRAAPPRSTTTTPGVPEAPVAPILADTGGPPFTLGTIPPPHPGPAQVVTSAPHPTNQIALTIDDGFCANCVAQYVAFAQQSGIHITFSPNGTYGSLWAPYADVLKPMIANRQVQIANHTWDHANLLTLSATAIQDELNRNDAWIQQAFGVTSRPFFRPPYGYYNANVQNVAASLGYTKILMWNGTLGDATLETPAQLIALAQQYLQPGTIMLGHANYPTVLSLFGQIQSIIAQRGLQPVTLDEMFGTSREIG
jgi:peptidoglycan/xylan/chitin deacetylase (PgdA/CDA1 family)